MKKDFAEVLEHVFHFKQFRNGQREIISALLDKRDALAVMPTGSGKSLCYQFPALYTEKLVIVVSPLIALMKDQVLALHRRGVAAACLYSGQDGEEKRKIFQQIESGGGFVLYLSPERVQMGGFQRWILRQNVVLFAIDEAHCVSQWGHDFRQEYRKLEVLRRLRPDVPMLALTASATPSVLQDISQTLKMRRPKKVIQGFYRENLYYQVEVCRSVEDKWTFVRDAVTRTEQGRVLIYCATRRATEEVAGKLRVAFPRVGFYHGGLSATVRHEIQERYIDGRLRIMVATNAFGMGLDQSNVRLVVHFQIPSSIDALYQEMGRAGRDGAPAVCLLLYTKEDRGLQSYFIRKTAGANSVGVNKRWSDLAQLIAYVEGRGCRHGEILKYYGDLHRIDRCTHCDSCAPQAPLRITLTGLSVIGTLREAARRMFPRFSKAPMNAEILPTPHRTLT
jgi:ATP-dependent DNA helicase RecQ